MMRNVFETALAAMVLLVAGVFLAFASNIGNVAPVKGYEVIAKFNSIDGLALGNDVRIGGVKIGTVTGLTIDQKDYRAVVKMEVVSVTPHMVAVPDQASALPNSVQRGRFILLRPRKGEPQERIDQLLHGESVVIRVKPKSVLDLLKQI